MKALLIVLLALVVAVVAGHYVAEDPGFVVFGYGGKVVRTTFALFALLLAGAILALFIVLKLFREMGQLRTQFRRRATERRRRRALDALAHGRLAMASGDFAVAERLFTRALDEDSRPEIHYLAAAEAAQAQHASGRRDNYLSLACDANPEIRPALDLQRAQWMLESGQLREATALVEGLRKRVTDNPHVLKLCMSLYRLNNDNEALLNMLPDLRREHIISHDDADALERQSLADLLVDKYHDIGELKSTWNGLARNLRAQPELVSVYVRGLCRHGADFEAEQIVRKRVERAWDSSLVALYGEIQCEPLQRQMDTLKSWSAAHDNDPGLQLAGARQAIRAGQWAEARAQIERLMKSAPSPLLYQLLAAIAEGEGDPKVAIAHRQAGLELATGEQIGPILPAPAAAPGAA